MQTITHTASVCKGVVYSLGKMLIRFLGCAIRGLIGCPSKSDWSNTVISQNWRSKLHRRYQWSNWRSRYISLRSCVSSLFKKIVLLKKMSFRYSFLGLTLLLSSTYTVFTKEQQKNTPLKMFGFKDSAENKRKSSQCSKKDIERSIAQNPFKELQ